MGYIVITWPGAYTDMITKYYGNLDAVYYKGAFFVAYPYLLPFQST